MLEVKAFNVHLITDGTEQPVIALRVEGKQEGDGEEQVIKRGGYYQSPSVIMIAMTGHPQIGCTHDPHYWRQIKIGAIFDRECLIFVHYYIEENWDRLTSGSVLKVRFDGDEYTII